MGSFYDFEQFADVIGLELVRVQQQNLFRLIADRLLGKLFGISKHFVAIREIAARELLLQRTAAPAENRARSLQNQPLLLL